MGEFYFLCCKIYKPLFIKAPLVASAISPAPPPLFFDDFFNNRIRVQLGGVITSATKGALIDNGLYILFFQHFKKKI